MNQVEENVGKFILKQARANKDYLADSSNAPMESDIPYTKTPPRQRTNPGGEP